LFEPEGVQASGDRLYIADTNNHLVRVADLKSRQVHTLQLRGVDRLPAAGLPAERAAPVRVGPGLARLVLDVRLPKGYKRNPEANAIVQVRPDGQSKRYAFGPDQEIAWTVDLAESQDFPVDFTLYYCQTGGGKDSTGLLCLIHERKMVVPVQVVPGGPGEARIPVAIAAPQTRGK
jgi:hypothetical protein